MVCGSRILSERNLSTTDLKRQLAHAGPQTSSATVRQSQNPLWMAGYSVQLGRSAVSRETLRRVRHGAMYHVIARFTWNNQAEEQLPWYRDTVWRTQGGVTAVKLNSGPEDDASSVGTPTAWGTVFDQPIHYASSACAHIHMTIRLPDQCADSTTTSFPTSVIVGVYFVSHARCGGSYGQPFG
jgi:hypothetical protein